MRPLNAAFAALLTVLPASLQAQLIVPGQGVSFVVPLESPATGSAGGRARAKPAARVPSVSKRRLAKLAAVRRLVTKAERSMREALGFKSPRRQRLRLGTALRQAERAAKQLAKHRKRFRRDAAFQRAAATAATLTSRQVSRARTLLLRVKRRAHRRP